MTRKVFNPYNFSSLSFKQEMLKSCFRETTNQNKQFQKTKTKTLNFHIESDNGFNGTVVNRALSSLLEGPLILRLQSLWTRKS